MFDFWTHKFRIEIWRGNLKRFLTYLITIFAFAVELEVLAHFSSELVDIWSWWSEIIIQCWIQIGCHGGSKRWFWSWCFLIFSGGIWYLFLWFEIGIWFEHWSVLIELWTILRHPTSSAAHWNVNTADVKLRLILLREFSLCWMMIIGWNLRSCSHWDWTSSGRVSRVNVMVSFDDRTFVAIFDHLIQGLLILWGRVHILMIIIAFAFVIV